MNFTITHRFNKNTTLGQRTAIVIQLRKDGFSASEEYDRENNNYLLRTNATSSQVRLSSPFGAWVIHD